MTIICKNSTCIFINSICIVNRDIRTDFFSQSPRIWTSFFCIKFYGFSHVKHTNKTGKIALNESNQIVVTEIKQVRKENQC